MLENSNLASLAALPTPLPPVSSDEVYTIEQWTTLLSICEIFLPSITSSRLTKSTYAQVRQSVRETLPEGAGDELADRYLAETVAGDERFKENIRRRLITCIPTAQVKGLGFLLSALHTRIGSFAMTGSTTPLHAQPLALRSRIVLQWSGSYLGPLRALYFTGESLTKVTWLAMSHTLHQVLDFPKVPKQIERHPSYDFQFLDFSNKPKSETVSIKTDVVIIGSGCGAGVVAEHLAVNLAKLNPKPRILLLEKGYFHPSSHFPMDNSASGIHLFEGGGALMSDDSSIGLAAGSTFGGGGTVNWSASLQPQHFVREEWATKHKLPFLRSQGFQTCLDEVCEKMGVCKMTDEAGKAKIEHNRANEMLLEGARRMGLTAEVVPQNTAGQRHWCGRCSAGCASAVKQSPANYWLPEASKNGVEFIQGCFVEKILWDETSSPKRAMGLKATWTSKSREETRTLNISASRVIVSAGALHSPLVLHRSGLTPEVNKHIGSNLHLHPTISVSATFSHRIDPWDGPILTSAVTSLENIDGQGHGPKVEIMLGTPDMMCTLMPYRPQISLGALTTSKDNDEAALKTALDYKLRLAKHGHSFGLIAIQRDHADPSNAVKSYVYADADDFKKVKVHYTPSAKDRECLLQGVMMAARIAYTMDAEVIDIFSPLIPIFHRRSAAQRKTDDSLIDLATAPQQINQAADDEAFEQWLSGIKAKGISLLDPRFSKVGSAHQMSTCRMSASPQDGVVDPRGKVWGTENVYIADASVLPSASGVNPMISTMGLSLHISKNIVEDIKGLAR